MAPSDHFFAGHASRTTHVNCFTTPRSEAPPGMYVYMCLAVGGIGIATLSCRRRSTPAESMCEIWDRDPHCGDVSQRRRTRFAGMLHDSFQLPEALNSLLSTIRETRDLRERDAAPTPSLSAPSTKITTSHFHSLSIHHVLSSYCAEFSARSDPIYFLLRKPLPLADPTPGFSGFHRRRLSGNLSE